MKRSAAALGTIGLAAALLGGCASVAPPAPAPAAAPLPAPEPVSIAIAVALPEPPAAPAAATEPPAPPPPPLPRTRLDPAADAERASLWARIRDGYAIPDLDDDLVRKWEQYYATRPDYVQRMTQRGARYLFHIVEEIDRRGMPLEIALLPFVESAFDPQALSHARAAGMWQFMPGTGKAFELQQNLFRDDRRDVLASTRAALDYLSALHRRFGDWHLALAAYNWGQGKVSRALQINHKRGRPSDYSSLKMPDETRNYVPKLQAVKNIVAAPERFALQLPEIENHPFFLSVPIERDVDAELVARLAGLPFEEFRQLNPQLNKPVILAAGTPQVLLPYDNANRFVRELQAHRGPLASWTAWVAPRALKPAEAAKIVGTSDETLREVNRIPPRMVIQRGSTLVVPRDREVTANVAEHIADNASIALAPEPWPARRVAIKAGRNGDTVAAIARRFGLSAASVAQLNGLAPTAQFRPGQAIHLLLPPTRVAARAQAPAPVKRKQAARTRVAMR
jgi:membrane-bound lytic murein transglycosylase D